MRDKTRKGDAAIADSIMENEYENLCDSGWGSNFELYTAAWIKATSYATFVERERAAAVCEKRWMGDMNREDQEARNCAADIRKGGAS